MGCEEGLELHTASLRKGTPAGDSAGTCPLWLLINTEGTAHKQGTFDSGGQGPPRTSANVFHCFHFGVVFLSRSSTRHTQKMLKV